MQLSRLFNVLVVQGSLLVGACDDDATDVGSSSDSTAGSDDGATTEGSTGELGSTGDDGDPSTSTDDGEGSSTGEQGSSSDGPVDLECSDPPDPSDPCGCPCCWAVDCVNTDDACCAGFSDACTPV
jgi:hypothetical protein